MISLKQMNIRFSGLSDLDFQVFLKAYDFWFMIELFYSENNNGKVLFNHKCHSICMAFRLWMEENKEQKVTQADGFFAGFKDEKWVGWEHSWILTPDGAIIDLHPVGIVACSPLLIPTKGKEADYQSMLYFESPEVRPIAYSRENFREAQTVLKAVKIQKQKHKDKKK